jgi:fatty acid desaturase
VLATAFVGISYGWWMNKHSQHHANPNEIGKDPDIEVDRLLPGGERGWSHHRR